MKKFKKLCIFACMLLMFGALSGCTKASVPEEPQVEEQLQETAPVSSESAGIPYRFASTSEGIELRMANTDYFENMTQNDLDFMISIPGMLDGTIAHELFHILSRNDPEFRQEMYAVLGFTIEQEPEFSPEIRAILASNPDVEVFDSYAMFNINGQRTKCAVVTLLKTPYREGAYLVDNFSTGIVPYDAPDTYYTIDQVSNFWDVFGENGNYLIAAEEGISDNFASAVVYGMDGREYKNPEIIQSMLDVMAKR